MSTLKIKLSSITANARAIVRMCARYGIEVVGVTKGCCGMPQVAQAMLDGGVAALADSRLTNIRRMREAGITAPMMLIRSPGPSKVAEAVALANVSLNSELEVIEALAWEARSQGKLHQVILMVDVGERREGFMPHEVADAARRVEALEGIHLLGLGSNVGCMTGVLPSEKNLALLVELVRRVEEVIGRKLAVVSGGSTTHLLALEEGIIPPEVNQLRVGEGILLGRNARDDGPLPYARQDAFTLAAEIIEVKWKPGAPEGELSSSHLWEGDIPPQGSLRLRAVAAVGLQDVRVDKLIPRLRGARIVGASSDHLVLDVTDSPEALKVGDWVEFDLLYPALMTAMASPYVEKSVAI